MSRDAVADPVTVSVFLDGSSFLQAGSVTNTTDVPIVALTYSLGASAPGIATWEELAETPAGTRTDRLSDGTHYQTFIWSGINVLPGATFSFSGFDIDYIVGISPLEISHLILDDTGRSLRRASFTASLANGTRVSAPLLQRAWSSDQRLTLSESSAAAVPEPSTVMLLGAGALAAAHRVLRRGNRRSLR